MFSVPIVPVEPGIWLLLLLLLFSELIVLFVPAVLLVVVVPFTDVVVPPFTVVPVSDVVVDVPPPVVLAVPLTIEFLVPFSGLIAGSPDPEKLFPDVGLTVPVESALLEPPVVDLVLEHASNVNVAIASIAIFAKSFIIYLV